METIYKGTEPLLAHKLIERTIKERDIEVGKIKSITVDTKLPPADGLQLIEIRITIYTVKYSYQECFYSKEIIEHGYEITYLQHLQKMKKIKTLDISKCFKRGNDNAN